MLNYIRAEFYRIFNRIYFWCMIGVVASLALIGVALGSSTTMSFEILFVIGIKAFTVPVFLLVMIIDMVTSEEQKNQTLKNVVSFGTSRKKLVLSKLIVTVSLSIIAAIIILIVYFGSGAVLLGIGKDFSLNIVSDFTKKLIVAVPLWIGVISVGTFLAFVLKNNTAFAFTYAGVFLMTEKIIKLLTFFVSDKFKYVNDILITTQLTNLSAETVTSHNLIFAAIIGTLYTIIFTILSILYFDKMEVK